MLTKRFMGAVLALAWSAASAEAAVDCTAPIVCKGGTLSADESWDSPLPTVYVVTGAVTVPSGVTLTVGPGVVVKFESFFNGHGITVAGTLNANGSSGSKVYFTSNRDDTIGGDTNGLDSNTPGAGDWGSIRFNAGSGGSISHAELRYGGYSGGGTGVVYVSGAAPTLDNVTVESSYRAAISAGAEDSPVITNFSASNTPIGGLEIRSGSLTSNSAWSNTGIAYILNGSLTVSSGATLTIAGGVVVKFESFFNGYGLTVGGTLNINGTSGSKVYFTSNRDDTVAGDTNGANSNTPGAGDWGSIRFNAGSGGSISHSELRYGGYSGGGTGVIYVSGAAPSLSDIAVKNSYRAAISAGAEDSPVITNFSASNTPIGGLEIRSGALTTNAAWSNTGIAYILNGSLTVASGASLTIAAGVVVKFESFFNGYGITVAGTLNVNGSSGSKVYFTSNRDDTIAGDTNGANSNTPAAGDWGGIWFTSGGSGSVSHAELRYAGYSGGNSAAIYIDAAAPTLGNIVVRNSYWAALSAGVGDSPVVTAFSAFSTPIGGLEIRGGALTANATWSNIGIAHIPTGDVTVSSGATLTIAAGVIVKFRYGAGTDLRVAGILNVNGTAANRVRITSNKDDSIGGDTNGNGASAGVPGDWDNVQILAGGTAVLAFADIFFANRAVWANGGNATMNNCTLANNVDGVYHGGGGNTSISRSNLVDNSSTSSSRAVRADAGASTVQATNNWWGTAAGPSLNAPNGVTAGVDYVPWASFFIFDSLNATLMATPSSNPSVYGQSLEITATASGTGPTPTGVVTFKDGGSTVATASLSAGSASFVTTTLAVGSHAITAEYAGDGYYVGGSSPGYTQTVTKASTALALASSTETAIPGQPVTLTATVAVVAPGSGAPTGSVDFKDGATVIGSAPLSANVASFTTSSLAPGAHTLTAAYTGSSDFLPSSSAEVVVTVALPSPTGSGSIIDYDLDNKSDLTVFHEASGLWYLRNSTNGAVSAVGYGGAGYTRVPGDYDGDGITDLGVYHPPSGLWFIRNSTTMSTTTTGFGGPEYKPVRGDFDGDRKTDIAVFHDPTGLWFIKRSSTGAVDTIGYGASGYVPVPADYDGDGKTDLAVYHPPSGLWFTRSSATGATTTTGFGGMAYKPVRGDFDGDGKNDLAVYHESSGLWFLKNSSNGAVTTLGYGGSGYVPVPGRYDADVTTDIAVYHEASGLWFMRSSLTGASTAIGFGGSGYAPVN